MGLSSWTWRRGFEWLNVDDGDEDDDDDSI